MVALDTFDAYRALFPVTAEQVYLNHAGVAPTSTRVAEAVRAWMEDVLHHGVRHEREWEARNERARRSAALLVGAGADEVAFVRNTSHGLGLVAEGLDWRPGDEVAVASSLEYPSTVYPWLHLRERGVSVREIAASGGGVRAEDVARALTPRTRLVAVSSVQYATGVATDLDAVGEACARAGALLCVDGIQSVGCVPVDVKRSRIHFLAADSHKWMLGIAGSGFLYVDRGVLPRVRPVLVGWKSTTDAWNFDRPCFELRADAAKLEEGSPAYTGVWALGAALELLEEVGVPAIHARVQALLARLEAGLSALGCEVGPHAPARAGILTLRPPGGEGAVRPLYDFLKGQGVTLAVRRGRLRLSPHFYNSPDEMDRVAELVARHLRVRGA
jgi:selenocysteine lyase/cysteine desulfurase